MPGGSYSVKMTKITAMSPWDGSNDVWGTAGPVTDIAFLTLQELISLGPVPPAGTPLAIFAPVDNGYYAFDFGWSGGGGLSVPPTVTITYGGAPELRQRVVTVYKLMHYLTGEPTVPAPGVFEKKYMSEAVPTFVSAAASYQGGHWVRMYLGINTAWDVGTDPNGDHVFTYASPAGTFTATMTITIA
jgi:hypothetical protein